MKLQPLPRAQRTMGVARCMSQPVVRQEAPMRQGPQNFQLDHDGFDSAPAHWCNYPGLACLPWHFLDRRCCR
eukprot:6802773-Karenia_brevis.AAC.1